MLIVNLSIGCLDIIDTPSINNTRRAITKSNIKYVQINNIPKETGQEFCLVVSHYSWSKSINEDLHLYLSEITNQPTWTNNLAGAQNAINDVVAWLNIPIGGMGSGDASEATLQQVLTVLQGGVTRTPTIIRVTSSGIITAGNKSVSIYNSGVANGIVLGVTIKPGESYTWSTNLNNETLGAISYNATGTEFVITTL